MTLPTLHRITTDLGYHNAMALLTFVDDNFEKLRPFLTEIEERISALEVARPNSKPKITPEEPVGSRDEAETQEIGSNEPEGSEEPVKKNKKKGRKPKC